MGYVHINSVKLQAVLMEMSQAATRRAAHKLREKIRQEIVQSGRILTGEMMEKIDVDPEASGPKSAHYSVTPKTKQFVFQDQGTRGTPYRPGQILRFKPKGSGVYIFRASSGPISAAHFLDKAILRMSPSDWGK